jgi:hypothetical protein
MKRLALGVVMVLALTGCSKAAAPASAPADQVTPPADVGVTTTNGPIPDGVETGTEAIGSAIGITCGGVSCLQVTVIKTRFAAKYGSGSAADEVKVKGHQFLSVYVKYRSLLSGTSFGPHEWQLFVNDDAITDQAFMFYAPEPALSYGSLPKGTSVSGWIHWEVPKTGRVTIAYGGNYSQAPVFEISLRSK